MEVKQPRKIPTIPARPSTSSARSRVFHFLRLLSRRDPWEKVPPFLIPQSAGSLDSVPNFHYFVKQHPFIDPFADSEQTREYPHYGIIDSMSAAPEHQFHIAFLCSCYGIRAAVRARLRGLSASQPSRVIRFFMPRLPNLNLFLLTHTAVVHTGRQATWV